MNLTVDIVRHIQRALGFTGSDVNGQRDAKTDQAITDYLKKRRSELHPEKADDILTAGRDRKVIAFGQLRSIERGIDPGPVDGVLGHRTDDAFRYLIFRVENGKMPHAWVGHLDNIPNPNGWPEEKMEALIDFYGDPKRPNTIPIKWVRFPYKFVAVYNSNKRISGFDCHVKVADSLQRVFTDVLAHYGEDGIEELGLNRWGGCHVVRAIRGGTRPSTHTWGISVDFMPKQNQLKWQFDEAKFSRPDYDKWWEIWESEGWVGLGRTKGYDWMHIQAARAGV